MRCSALAISGLLLFSVSCESDDVVRLTQADHSDNGTGLRGFSLPLSLAGGASFSIDVVAAAEFRAHVERVGQTGPALSLTVSRAGQVVDSDNAHEPEVGAGILGQEDTFAVTVQNASSGFVTGVLVIEVGHKEGGGGGPGNTGDGAVRLFNPNSNIPTNAGLLQIQFNGEWAGVCDDNWDQVDAEVACRQLGGTLINFETGHTGPSDKFWLDDVQCQGFEQALGLCDHGGIGDENCSASEHVFVRCDLPNLGGVADGELRSGPSGSLEMFHNGLWKGVCDDGFNQAAAEVACRQMGGPLINFQTGVSGDGEFWVDDLSCNGSEENLLSCGHDDLGDENCSGSEHVRVLCDLPNDPLNPQLGDIRVTGFGMLQIFNGGNWGAVCDDGFNQAAAEVACRQMGLTLFDFDTGVDGGTDVFFLDDLSCTGDESHLLSCGHDLDDENCSGSEHVRLRCQ